MSDTSLTTRTFLIHVYIPVPTTCSLVAFSRFLKYFSGLEIGDFFPGTLNVNRTMFSDTQPMKRKESRKRSRADLDLDVSSENIERLMRFLNILFCRICKISTKYT